MPHRVRSLRTLGWAALGLALLAGALLAWPRPAWAASPGAEGAGGTFFGLVPLIVFIPLVGMLINLVWGRQLGERWVGIVGSTAAGLAFVIAVLQFISLRANHFEPVIVPLADWITIGDLNVPWAFQVDTLSVTMMLVITGVGTLIHIYSIGYMHEDVRVNGDPGRFPRFFVYLNLFLAAMLMLVSGNSYLTMFVGWEGVGLCSYLLIGFWFEHGEKHVGNARAGRKAFVVNRVGDWAMLLAMFLMFWTFGTLTYTELFERLAVIRLDQQGQMIVTGITLLLLIGATGKSAQIPLYVWLPDAMAGPTPVSALIHAATMVTAGIYMITRSSALYALAPFSSEVVAIVGAVTALFAATMAVGQFDIKKVLAYSTISQLGFMIAAVGLGAYVAGMFHLVTHAFFKALLFLSAGSVIHAMEHGHHALAAHGASHAAPKAGKGAKGKKSGGAAVVHKSDSAGSHGHEETGKEATGHNAFDPQDMRNMGGLWQRLPVTKWVFLVGSLALAGIPPLSGFWSKDEILLDAFEHHTFVYILLTFAATLTAFYVGRQVLMVFFGRARTAAASHAAESPPVMTVPLIILAVLAAVGGFMNLPAIAGWSPPGAQAFGHWLDYTLNAARAEGEAVAAATPELNFMVAGIATGLALLALAGAYVLYRARPTTATERDPLQGSLGPVFGWLRDKWYIDELYHLLIIRPFNWLASFTANIIDWRFWHDWFHDTLIAGLFNFFARFTADFVDLGFIDGVANGLADLSKAIARRLRGFQSGYVRSYALMVFLGVVVVLGYMLFTR